MRSHTSVRTRRAWPLARGFSLIELMVALMISLFLIGGMVVILQNVRSTDSQQRALSQLQDNERLAMTLITDVIQSAGYFPNPAFYTSTTALPVSPSFTSAGIPALTGGSNAQGDTITDRYAPDSTGDMYNCMGGTNGVSPYDTWENTFQVDANGELTCTFWSQTTNVTQSGIVLVKGLTNGQGGQPDGMTILYGVNTGSASNGTCVDTYMNATQVTAKSDWGNVCSVQVTLTFVNPIPPADGSAPTVQFTRTIAVMNQAGANT